VCMDELSGCFFVTDTGNNTIRMISPSGVVTTIAGGSTQGHQNGVDALFDWPQGICFDNNQNLIVADERKHVIRMINTAEFLKSLHPSPSNEMKTRKEEERRREGEKRTKQDKTQQAIVEELSTRVLNAEV